MAMTSKNLKKVKYLGLVIDNTLSGESIVQNIISKVSGKLKFLYRHNSCLDFNTKKYYVLRYYSVISTILVLPGMKVYLTKQ